MNFIDKTFIKFTIRTWLCILLMAGSFLFSHGVIKQIELARNTIEYSIGICICIFSIFIGAIPSNVKSNT